MSWFPRFGSVRRAGSDCPRVLHVVWNLIRGGTEGQCARVAMALRQPVAVSRREGFFLEEVERLCGPVYEMQIRHLVGFQTLGEVRRLARHITEGGFDLVHAWDADAAIFGSWAARLAGVPYITSRRDMGEIYSPQKSLLMKEADHGARAIVTNAEAIKRHLFDDRRIARKVHVIPNVLDLDEFDRLAGEPFSRADELPPGPRVVMVARLDPEKDATTFLRAAARLSATRASFLVAGDGMERQRLEDLAAELKLNERLKFLGDVKDVPALLRLCDVGVLVPKSNEGLSNSILEYMAAKLPVVATDCGGNAEVVTHGRTGYVVKTGDEDAVADAIEHALNGGGRRMGEEGRRRVEKVHRPDAVAAQFADLYRNVRRA
jgi:L-malate glycosyltransferase